MRAECSLVLSLAAALAVATAPSVVAQASAEPDADPLAAAAEDVRSDGDAYAAGTQDRAAGIQALWEGYADAATRGSRAGATPVPTDESAATFGAAGEQGAATVAFAGGSAGTVAEGGSSSSANTVDSVEATPPEVPSDGPPDEEPQAEPEPGPEPTSGEDASGGGEAETDAEAEAEEPAVDADGEAPTVPLPPTDEAGPAEVDGPAPAPDDGPSRAIGDGTKLPTPVTAASAPIADGSLSAVALGAAVVLVVAAVAGISAGLADRQVAGASPNR